MQGGAAKSLKCQELETASKPREVRVTLPAMSGHRSERIQISAGDGTDVGLYIAHPGGTPRAGLLVMQEIFGVNDHIRDVTRRFAREGYLAVAPDLFHRAGEWFEGRYDEFPPALAKAHATTQDHIRADLRAAYGWLASALPAGARAGAIGFCMGGRVAFVANGILPLACAVSFYGANIPASLSDLAATQSGPLLLFWGGRDAMIDAAQRRGTADLLAAAGKPYVDVTFGDADHGFFCDARDKYHPPSARQALSLTRAFLEEHLVR